MAGWKMMCILCVAASAMLFVTSMMINGTTPQFVLVRRIRQLQAQNEYLHNSIRHLAGKIEGGSREPGLSTAMRGKMTAPEVGGQTFRTGKCDVVHVAMVVAGYKACRTAATLIKSILFYRRTYLHFHFLSDQSAQHSLSVLFDTWQLNAVNITFYSIGHQTLNLSWIPNLHYSGVYGLMKLTLPTVLPVTLERVIALDIDTMLNTDVVELWAFFTEMGDKLVGLVENQSDWYLGRLWKGHKPWPALGRGYNTGVMLLNLQAMREKDWYSLWQTVTVKTLKTYQSTALADQDIVNTVIKEHPSIHFTLPCSWNVQLSEHTLSDYCYNNAEEFKLVHWNSPMKLDVVSNNGPYFRNLYKGFEGFNGDLFRTELLACKAKTTTRQYTTDTTYSDPCSEYRVQSDAIFRTHPYFVSSDYTPLGTIDVTLVTQLSMDRLHILQFLCVYWEGPISLTVYATDTDTQHLWYYFKRSKLLQVCRKLSVHIVYKDSSVYPVNYLRNVALRNVQTSYVFLSDADFLPMPGLYHYLREAIRVLGMTEELRAYVVPAFETHRYRLDFPQNKSELLQLQTKGDVNTFRYHEWPQGHAPTNYDHWKTANMPYKVSWKPDYEPYVVVRSTVSRYDTRFAGFGWNKVSHIMELFYEGYDFVVLPDAFIIHMPHAPSQDITMFRSSKRYRDCLQVLKREFQMELLTKYGERTQT